MADSLATGNDTEKRWAVVAAYYSPLHTVHAIVAELRNEHPESHAEVIGWPRRLQLPGYESLEARLREAFNYAKRARYLMASGSIAATWFEPYATSATMLTNTALTQMHQLNDDLRAAVGWPVYVAASRKP